MFSFFSRSNQKQEEAIELTQNGPGSTVDWKLIKKTINEANLPSNKHTLVAFGFTGAAKKSFVHYLMGKSFISSQNKIVLASKESTDFKAVQEINLGNSNIPYNIISCGIDDPNYTDNISNIFALNSLLANSEYLIPVLVINYNHFRADRGQALRKLLHYTAQAFKNNQEALHNHLTVVISHAPDRVNMESIKNRLIELVDSESNSNTDEFELVANTIIDFIESWPESVIFLRLLKPRERTLLLSQLLKAQGNADICHFAILDEIQAQIQSQDEQKIKIKQWEENENVEKLISELQFVTEVQNHLHFAEEIHEQLSNALKTVVAKQKQRLVAFFELSTKQTDNADDLLTAINQFDEQSKRVEEALSNTAIQHEFREELIALLEKMESQVDTKGAEGQSDQLVMYNKLVFYEKVPFLASLKSSEAFLAKLVKTVERLKEKATKANSSEFAGQIEAYLSLKQLLVPESAVPSQIKAADILSECRKSVKNNENNYISELMKDLEILKTETQFSHIKLKLNYFKLLSHNAALLHEFSLEPRWDAIKDKLDSLIAQFLAEIDDDFINLTTKAKIKQISMLLSLDDEIQKPSHSLNMRFYSIISHKLQIYQKKIKKQFKDKKYAKVEVNINKIKALKEEMKSSSVEHALKSIGETMESAINLQNRQISQLLQQEKYAEIIPVHQELVEMRQIFDDSIDEKIQAAETRLHAQILEKLKSLECAVQKGRLNERTVHSMELLCQVLGLSDNYHECLSSCCNYLSRKQAEVLAAARQPFYDKLYVENLKRQLDAAEINEQKIFPQFSKEKLHQHVFHELSFQIRTLTRQMSDLIVNENLKDAEKCFQQILEANKITLFIQDVGPLVDAAEKILLDFKKDLQDSMAQHLATYSFLKASELINNFGQSSFRGLKVNLLHAFSTLNRVIEDGIYQYQVVIRDHGYLRVNTVDYIAIKKNRDNFVAGMELLIKYNASLCAVKASAESAWKLLKDKIEKEMNNNIKRLEDYNFIDFECLQEELLAICKAFSLNHKLTMKCKELFDKYEKPFDKLDGRTVHSINALFQGLSIAAKAGTLGYPQKHKKFLDYFDSVVATQCQKTSGNWETLESLALRLDDTLKTLCLLHVNQNKNAW